jgi:lysyl-tRNA synthetase class 1
MEKLEYRIKVAGNWVAKHGPEHLKFTLLENPSEVSSVIDVKQAKGLRVLAGELDKQWTPEEFHKVIYQTARNIGIEPNSLFEAIYLSLIKKRRGPKAAALILSLDKDFVKKRFTFFKQ